MVNARHRDHVGLAGGRVIKCLSSWRVCRTFPEDLYEAASLDGANSWQKFVNVTLPGLRNTTIFVIISTTIAAFGLFTQVDVMTSGWPG